MKSLKGGGATLSVLTSNPPCVVEPQEIGLSPDFTTRQNRNKLENHINYLEFQLKNKVLQTVSSRQSPGFLNRITIATNQLRNGLVNDTVVFENDGTGTYRGTARSAPMNYDEMLVYLDKIDKAFDHLYIDLGIPLNVEPSFLHLTEENIPTPEAVAVYHHLGTGGKRKRKTRKKKTPKAKNNKTSKVKRI